MIKAICSVNVNLINCKSKLAPSKESKEKNMQEKLGNEKVQVATVYLKQYKLYNKQQRQEIN